MPSRLSAPTDIPEEAYFPKSMELVNVAMKQVFEAVDKLNSRPRKCLGFKTPYEVFEELTGVNIRNIMGYELIT